MRTAESNRLAMAHSKRICRSIEQMDREMDNLIKDSPAWREREDLLRSMPGVGKATARTFGGGSARAGPLLSPADRSVGWRGANQS